MSKLYAFVDVPQSNHYWHRSPFTALERGTGPIRKVKHVNNGGEVVTVADCTEAMQEIADELAAEQAEPDKNRHPELHIDLCNLIKQGMRKEIEAEEGDARIPYAQINEIPDRVKGQWMGKYNPIIANMKGKSMDKADKKESTAIAKVEHKGIQITTFDDLWRFSKMVANTEFVPSVFKGQPQSICVAIQYGQELGFSPMQGLQSIAVINGKPSVYGDGLIALCLAHPDCEEIHEHFEDEKMIAYCHVKRKGHKMHTVSFGQNEAKAAKLWGKSGPWTLYPKRMLQMRARGFALRDKFPDALRGVITVEEAQDYPVSTTATVSDNHPVVFHEQAAESHYETDPEFQSGVIDEQPAMLDAVAEPASESEPTYTDTAKESPAMHVLQFGKHKGKTMGDIPMDYVRWLAKQSGDKPANIAARALVEIDDDAHMEHVQHDVSSDTMDDEPLGDIF